MFKNTRLIVHSVANRAQAFPHYINNNTGDILIKYIKKITISSDVYGRIAIK